MKHPASFENNRRIVLQALALGALGGHHWNTSAQVLGQIPRPMTGGQSIYSLKGIVEVNGQVATPQTRIDASDRIATGAHSQAIFVVGQDAFLLRENSSLQLSGTNTLVNVMRLVTGAVLTVFGKSKHRLEVHTATVGIRGTGVYARTEEDRAYICTCYGTVDIQATGSTESESIESRHHDAPRYVSATGNQRITPAPFIDHSDDELMLIETLVGRVPPFSLFDPGYGNNRRTY